MLAATYDNPGVNPRVDVQLLLFLSKGYLFPTQLSHLFSKLLALTVQI